MSIWCNRHNACSTFINSSKKIIETLSSIENNTSGNLTNHRKTGGLKNNSSKFELNCFVKTI